MNIFKEKSLENRIAENQALRYHVTYPAKWNVKAGRGRTRTKPIRRTWRKLPLFFLFLVVLLLAGCSEGQEDKNKTAEDEGPFVYYIDKSETKIVPVKYTPTENTKDNLVKEFLEVLSTESDDITLKRAIPEGLRIKATFSDSGGLSLYFNAAYNNLTGITEVLTRACIIKTLCQIKGVDDIAFYVDGSPLYGTNGKPINFMKADDFIDGSGAENINVTIYYANAAGDGLVASNRTIIYTENIPPIEKAIIDQLLNGPEIPNEPVDPTMKKSLPAGTELLKVTTKDGICYVDFNEKFLDKVPGVNPEVVLYSVVNSLDELSTINKIQFTINGSPKKIFQDDIAFDGGFERNLDLLEEDRGERK